MTCSDKDNYNLTSEAGNMVEEEQREIKKRYRFLNEADFDEWWSTLDSRVEKKSFGEQEEEIFKHSVILKSFRNEYETDSLISGGSIKLLLEGRINFNKKPVPPSLQKTSLEVLIPGYNQNSFIPNTSCLTFNEMAICQAIIDAGSPQTMEQSNVWAVCKPKLDEEQKQYIQFAKEQWIADNFKRHALIKPQVKELVDQFWKARLERVYTYPKFYTEKENIALTSTNSEEVEVKFNKLLGSIGRPAGYHIPDLWTFDVNVNTIISSLEVPPVGWSKFRDNKPSCYKRIHPKLIDEGYNSDVSKDKIAEKLAKENGVNIVMSSSAFIHLVDHCAVGTDSAWSLPITVLEYQTDHSTKRIAFIDKKLPPLSMTAVDRNKYFAKLALRKLFVKTHRNYRDPAASVYDADSVETFGVDNPKKKKTFPNLKKQKKNKCLYCLNKENENSLATSKLPDIKENNSNVKGDTSDSDESSSFYIDIKEEETLPPKPEDNETDIDEHDVVAETANLECGNVCCCTYEWVEDQEKLGINKNKKLNYKVSYNLWNFNSSASQNYMSKNCSKNLKIIIRTTAEGHISEKNEKDVEPIQKLYKLSPKLEYQTEFGAEAATTREILKEWASTYIRPSTTLARVRLDGVTGELIQVQKLTATELVAESQRLYKFNPKDRLPSVHAILVKLSVLPAGMYMLCFRPNTGTFVKLYRSVQGGGNQVFNIHLQYNMVNSETIASPRSPFPPLDPAILTPTFQYFKRIPCTFVPKKLRERKSLLQDNSDINPPPPKMLKKKKKKKKNKK